ncbi:MAG: fatty acid/phospholipid synthesis protein PlsX, partial [Candidatus Binatus sp.]|nr:fatty acid/phospholipid synthesis protein PlsX [Candidatus Binatus sp.]
VYWRYIRNVSRPRVGILSNGEEASKGTDLTRAAAAMLQAMPTYVNYVGYVEGRDINRGKADVVVTDGFTGNVALKTMEGFASFMLGNLREVFSLNWRSRFAYLLVRKTLSAMRERLDPHEYGGAPLLGVSGVSIIAHGSSNPHAIRNAIRAAANEQLVTNVNAEILEILGKIEPAGPVKQASGKGFRALFSKMRERLHRRDREAEAAKSSDGQVELVHEIASDNHGEHPIVEEASPEPIKTDAALETIAAVEVSQTVNGVNGADKPHTTGELQVEADAPHSSEPPKSQS